MKAPFSTKKTIASYGSDVIIFIAFYILLSFYVVLCLTRVVIRTP